MADVSEFLNAMPPMKGERISPVQWSEGYAKTCLGVLEKPAENVAAIIEKFADVDDGKDYRARYLLRGVVTVAANPDQKEKLEPVIGAIAAVLSSDRNKEVKAALIRELKFCGTPSAAKAIAVYLTDEALCADAADALQNIGEGATALLVAALANAQGYCRTQIVHALAALAEPAALTALQGALADKELETRLSAAWGLARVADAGSADALLKAANAAADWERFQLTASTLLLAEKLIAAGKKAEAAKLYTDLKTTRTDKADAYVVEAANRGLAG